MKKKSFRDQNIKNEIKKKIYSANENGPNEKQKENCDAVEKEKLLPNHQNFPFTANNFKKFTVIDLRIGEATI